MKKLKELDFTAPLVSMSREFVRVLCTDRNSARYPVVVLIRSQYTGFETVAVIDEYGYDITDFRLVKNL